MRPVLILKRCVLLTLAVNGCRESDAPTGMAPVRRTSANALGSSFFLAWSHLEYRDDPIQLQNKTTADYREYRLVTGMTISNAWLRFAARHPGHLYVIGDEPDGKSCKTPSQYAQIYHNYVVALSDSDATAKFSPAGFVEPIVVAECPNGLHSTDYAQAFYDSYVNLYGAPPPVDEWRFHDFGLNITTGDVPAWWSRVKGYAAWAASHGAPMVLGSWGFLSWTESNSAYREDMRQAMRLLRNDPRIVQAVWWSYEHISQNHYLVSDTLGTLTSEGQQYIIEPSIMSATISGPSTASSGQSCTWTANVTNGISPLSYSWTVNGSAVGSNSSSLTYANGGSPFTVAVKVTDGDGVQLTKTKAVSIGPNCPF
jgi:hypothetical protein